MKATENIDALKIILPMKPKVLKRYDILQTGESFIFRNSHDPIILYYQLLEDRGNSFSWEYLERTPSQWRVRITKLAPNVMEPTIGEIAVSDYRKAELFWKFGINYCCGGKKTLKQACEEVGINERILEKIYSESKQHKEKDIYDFDSWDADFLMDYIVSTHHSYAKLNLERLNKLAFKVTVRHGYANPELKELSGRLNNFLGTLKKEMEKEEKDIFPSLKKLLASKKAKKEGTSASITVIKQALKTMEEAHRLTGDALKFFRKTTRNYKLPKDACVSYTHLFALLLEFENDLVQHVHLENNILFPKALALAKY